MKAIAHRCPNLLRRIRVLGFISTHQLMYLRSYSQGQPSQTREDTVDESNVYAICQVFGLTLLHEAWKALRQRGSPIFETRKIAVRKDRLIAILRGTIHVLPAGISIAICLLNSIGYYIGSELAGPQGQDYEKLAGLQMAAKLHELTMLASIGDMLVHYVRHGLLFGAGLPFGMIFAGQQFKDISFLWSLEFWGTIRGFIGQPRRKWAMILLLTVCTLLGLTVGPSSATIIKPRLGDWPAGGTDFWLGLPPYLLWSTNITKLDVSPNCAIDTGDNSCPYGNWQALDQGYFSYWSRVEPQGLLPGNVRIPSPKSVRELYPQTRSPSWQYNQSFTVATTQFTSAADAVLETGRLWAWVVAAAWRSRGHRWRFWSHVDATYTVAAHQPVVHSRCLRNKALSSLFFYDLSDLEAFRKNEDFPIYLYPESVREHALNDSFPTNFTQIRWLTIPQKHSGIPALGAIISIANNKGEVSNAYTCSFDARLAPAKTQGKRNNWEVITSHVEASNQWTPAGTSGTYGADNKWPSMTIDPIWAAFLNPTVGGSNLTVLDTMATSTGHFEPLSNVTELDRICAIESILALMLVNGIARNGYNTTLMGDLIGWDLSSDAPVCGAWCTQMMPIGGKSMGDGGAIFTLDDTLKANATKLTMHASATGYAYSPNGFAQTAAIVILLIYSTAALAHWGFTIWSGESSSSWSKGAEVVALALNSRCPEELRNTGVGIETSRVFTERVRIMGRGDRTELVFGEGSGQERVERNAWYS